RRLNLVADDLRAVVLIHEIGHWITHRMPQGEWLLQHFDATNTNVHEGWAQLLTFWVAAEVEGKFKTAFEKLNLKQSPPYHVFEDFTGIDHNKIMGTLPGLRGLGRGAFRVDWEYLLNPPAPCFAIPGGVDFEINPPPRGMPENTAPKFQRIDSGEVLAATFVGLVFKDGEYMAGQITPMAGALYRYVPRNIKDGLAGFNVERNDIKARLVE
ncbi:MAG: hypothetical protein WCL16_12625, partial [bacterium]